MALTKTQSRQVVLDMKAEYDDLTRQIEEAKVAEAAARKTISQLDTQREPIVEELRTMAQRHKRLFNEDA